MLQKPPNQKNVSQSLNFASSHNYFLMFFFVLVDRFRNTTFHSCLVFWEKLALTCVGGVVKAIRSRAHRCSVWAKEAACSSDERGKRLPRSGWITNKEFAKGVNIWSVEIPCDASWRASADVVPTGGQPTPLRQECRGPLHRSFIFLYDEK